MERKMTVVIADCSEEFRAELLIALQNRESLQVIGNANNWADTVRMVNERMPDILLLQPCDAEVLAKHLEEICGAANQQASDLVLEALIIRAIHDTGIPANIKGYDYLLEAVTLAIHDKSAIYDMTEKVYIPIAEHFHTTPTRVRSAIKRAIDIGWDRGDLDTLQSYFGYTVSNTKGMPTNSEYLATIAEKVCLRLKREKAVSQPAGDNSSIEEIVSKLLHIISVPAHIKGYQYLREAIIIAAEDMDVLNAVSKVLYPQVAVRFDTTPSRVDRAIRHAVEMAWEKGDQDTLERLFGYTVSNTKGKPTPSEFIALIAQEAQRRLKAQNN